MTYDIYPPIPLEELIRESAPEYKSYGLFAWTIGEDGFPEDLLWIGDVKTIGVYEEYKDALCYFIDEEAQQIWLSQTLTELGYSNG